MTAAMYSNKNYIAVYCIYEEKFCCYFIPYAPDNLNHKWFDNGKPIRDSADGEITYFCTECGLGLYWNGVNFEWAHNDVFWSSKKPIITCEGALMDNAIG